MDSSHIKLVFDLERPGAQPTDDMAVFRLRCRECGRSLGRWIVPRSGTATVGALPRLAPRGPRRYAAWAPFGIEGIGNAPGFRPETRYPGTVLEAICTCGPSWRKRRVRVSAAGLRRLLARLGWPDEVEL